MKEENARIVFVSDLVRIALRFKTKNQITNKFSAHAQCVLKTFRCHHIGRMQNNHIHLMKCFVFFFWMMMNARACLHARNSDVLRAKFGRQHTTSFCYCCVLSARQEVLHSACVCYTFCGSSLIIIMAVRHRNYVHFRGGSIYRWHQMQYLINW